MAKTNVYYGTGKRKTSVAKVKLVPGKGKITVNGKDVKEYFSFLLPLYEQEYDLASFAFVG